MDIKIKLTSLNNNRKDNNQNNNKRNYNQRNNDNRNFKNNRPNTYTNNKPRDLTPEQIKKNKRILEKVAEWQDFKFIKHLVCNDENCNTKLKAKELNGKVILQCPRCRSIQSYIPKAVLQTRFYVSNVLRRLQSAYHTLLNFESSKSGNNKK